MESILNDALTAAVEMLYRDKTSRIKAWDICHLDFQTMTGKNSKTIPETDKDFLMRSLFVYLASWGMFRGSGDLLGRNYLQFEEAIETVVKSKCWLEGYTERRLEGLYEDLVGCRLYSPLTCQKILSVIFGRNVPLDKMCKAGIEIIHLVNSGWISLPRSDQQLFGEAELVDLPSLNLVFPSNYFSDGAGANYPTARKADILFF